jgi:hypothetical protein
MMMTGMAVLAPHFFWKLLHTVGYLLVRFAFEEKERE